MEISDQVILFYLRSESEIHRAEQIQQLLYTIASKGYYIYTEAEEEMIPPIWKEWISPPPDIVSPLQASVSPEALTMIEHFCTEKQDTCRLQALFVTGDARSRNGARLLNGFEWSLSFDAEEKIIYVAYNLHRFASLNDEWEAFPRWLEVIQLIYKLLHPLYGYETDMMGGEYQTPQEEILAQKISYLYWLNLFGPEIIEKLGRERVESTSAQLKIPLDDGGVMLLPYVNFLPDFYQFSYTQVAEHLGLADPGTPWEAPHG